MSSWRSFFLDLWHTGQLALLLGPPNIGKSILATQIAESIATGTQTPLPANAEGVETPRLDKRGARGAGGMADAREQKVVLLDLNNTDAQFARRYTVPVSTASDSARRVSASGSPPCLGGVSPPRRRGGGSKRSAPTQR